MASKLKQPRVRAEPENAPSLECLLPKVTQMALYSFYNPHDRVILDCGTELITKQSHKAECDIYNILKQFQQTGILEHVNNSQAQYIDLPDTTDFQQSLAIIQEAEYAFASLPSAIRDHYKNDPSVFLGALSDPNERDRLTNWGVFKSAPELTPAKEAGGAREGDRREPSQKPPSVD